MIQVSPYPILGDKKIQNLVLMSHSNTQTDILRHSRIILLTGTIVT